MRTTFRYHFGTAAFGSLIIAIIKTVRAILTYIQKHAKTSGNIILQYIVCCLQCCMWCVEKCMKFLNKNAYIQTAIYGTSFCKSARRAFFLILRNILRVAAVNMVADFVLLIGKVIDFIEMKKMVKGRFLLHIFYVCYVCFLCMTFYC